ncbi:hypothetical protein F2Q68_00030814 [Brassica cretica]|uniref:Uncharacterized protein n=1 Tax=Brassica cretica TaxID=69181 RepID=A0A8S9G863_BRACR|nr:hypothetical protein F2Q68_00030814 [Brassica cretica]
MNHSQCVSNGCKEKMKKRVISSMPRIPQSPLDSFTVLGRSLPIHPMCELRRQSSEKTYDRDTVLRFT